MVSVTKTRFYHNSMGSRWLLAVKSVLGFAATTLPFNYLGVPIFQGKPTKALLQPIIDKLISRLATWKGSLLSLMGRVQLVKTVITGMLLHSFLVYAWPTRLQKGSGWLYM